MKCVQLARRRILDVLNASGGVAIDPVMNVIGCGSSLTDDVIATSQSKNGACCAVAMLFTSNSVLCPLCARRRGV